jgi:hypothetical protein
MERTAIAGVASINWRIVGVQRMIKNSRII